MVSCKERLIVEKQRVKKSSKEDSERRECWKQEEEEEEMDFRPPVFLQILSGQFHQQLDLPEKFVKDIQEKLAEVAILKGPSGATWEVGITTENNTLYFKNGWRKFVEDHSLEENDILLFYYCRNSRFVVEMCDGKTKCTKFIANLAEKRHASDPSFDAMGN